jgi:hypothetical protein
MQDSATQDARGIGRFNALTEWPRYREQMPGTARGGLAPRYRNIKNRHGG